MLEKHDKTLFGPGRQRTISPKTVSQGADSYLYLISGRERGRGEGGGGRVKGQGKTQIPKNVKNLKK
jgi:hypothetical protein